MHESHAELMFDLQDRNGDTHTYMVSPHVGMQGLEVVDAMLAIGLGPLAEAMFGAVRAAEAQKADGEATQVTSGIDLTTLLDNVDVKSVVTSAQTGLTTAGGMTKLAPLVMRYTTRDGRRLISEGNTAEFDMAYTRNWGEMRGAFMKVMEINGFFEVLVGFLAEA